jgi:hypothetical protein
VLATPSDSVLATPSDSVLATPSDSVLATPSDSVLAGVGRFCRWEDEKRPIGDADAAIWRF